MRLPHIIATLAIAVLLMLPCLLLYDYYEVQTEVNTDIIPKERILTTHEKLEMPPWHTTVFVHTYIKPAENITNIKQYPTYPAGCEPTSIAILLHCYNIETTVREMIDEGYLQGNYNGDIYSNGYMMPQGAVNVLNNYLEYNDSGYSPRDISGEGWETLECYLQYSIPALVWVNIDYSIPGSWMNTYSMWSGEHCVVAYGVDEDNVFISDPIQGMIEIPKQQFIDMWERCGAMALVIE